jgi:hypothetical protein
MINTVNYSLEEAEKGIVISFPTPSNLKQQNQYILYFDTPVSLPQSPANVINFEPSNGSYSIFGSNLFNPTVFIKIKSLRKTQTKTLLRLIIKDTSNTIIYTDYILIVCYPESVVSVTGKLLSSSSSNLGPNGGSLIQITGNNESTSSIVIGSTIQGPGLDQSLNRVSKTVSTAVSSSTSITLANVSTLAVGMSAYKQDGTSLGSIVSIDEATSTVVLSKSVTLNANIIIVFANSGSGSAIITVKSIVSDTVFELNQQIGNSIEYTGIYSLTTIFGCFTSTESTTIESPLYTILDENNNWTYKVKDQIIAQFIPETSVLTSNLIIFLPIKNTTLLAKDSLPAPIPEVSIIKLGGRVLNDSICISNI